jgi:PLP dependent protein
MTSISCEAERAAELANSLQNVQSKITAALGNSSNARKAPVLVAVSKLKPVSDIMGCYEASHRDFGENYVDELVGKASQVNKYHVILFLFNRSL